MQPPPPVSPNKDPNWNCNSKDLNSNSNPHVTPNQQELSNVIACGGGSLLDAERTEKQPVPAVGEDTAMRCTVCDQEIAVERERTVYRVGECGLVHEACLRCSTCGRSLAEDGRCFVRERDSRTLLCRADFYRLVQHIWPH